MRYQNVCLEALGYTLPDELVTSAEIERRLDSAEEFFFDAHSNFPFVCSVFGYDARSARARVRKMLDPIGQDRLKLRRFNDSHKEVLVVVAAS